MTECLNLAQSLLRRSPRQYDYHQDLLTEIAQLHQGNSTKHLNGNNRSEGAAHLNMSDVKSTSVAQRLLPFYPRTIKLSATHKLT